MVSGKFSEQAEKLFCFLAREWLLLASILALVLSSAYLKRIPSYSATDFKILYILFLMLATSKGLASTHLFQRLSKPLTTGKFWALKLVIATFVSSIFITNDMALVIFVPLTMSLPIPKRARLVALEILAANAGSALTPLGNPQNLFIYWFYKVQLYDFVLTILPFVATFGIVLTGLSLFIIKPTRLASTQSNRQSSINASSRSDWLYVGLFVILALMVVRAIPLYWGILVLIGVALLNPRNLLVDYSLLIIFFAFFGFTDNMRVLLVSQLQNHHDIFMLSVAASQFISNVPATLLFADFTSNWQALLWGVNVGGFGSLFASLANLIGFRAYTTQEGRQVAFLILFHVLSFIFLAIGITLHLILYPP